MIIISDSSPLIALVKKQELTLLKDLFNNILIPKAVYDELIDENISNSDQILHLKREFEKEWIKVKKIKNFTYPDLGLGKGETEAINASFEMVDDVLLLIDEEKGRKVSKRLGITILGTLGILLLAKKRKLKTDNELKVNLNTLITQGFYLSSNVILRFLEELEK